MSKVEGVNADTVITGPAAHHFARGDFRKRVGARIAGEIIGRTSALRHDRCDALGPRRATMDHIGLASIERLIRVGSIGPDDQIVIAVAIHIPR